MSSSIVTATFSAPHQANVIDRAAHTGGSRSGAFNSCVAVPPPMSLEHRQELLSCEMHAMLPRRLPGVSGNALFARMRRRSARASMLAQRINDTSVASKRIDCWRMTLKHECANVCRSVWCVVGRSCVTTSCTVRVTRELCHELNFPWWVYITAILTQWRIRLARTRRSQRGWSVDGAPPAANRYRTEPRVWEESG